MIAYSEIKEQLQKPDSLEGSVETLTKIHEDILGKVGKLENLDEDDSHFFIMLRATIQSMDALLAKIEDFTSEK